MQLAWAILSAQMATGLISAAFFGWRHGSTSAAAAFFGAVVAAVPGLYMAWHLLPRRDAQQLGRRFMVGQLGKLVLTAGLFVTAALLFGQQFLPLLATYAACLVCYWLGLILTR